MNSRLTQNTIILIILAAFLVSVPASAQSLLNKKVTLNANKQKLGTVLKSIEEQGGFYFSYQGHTVKTDSIVNLSVQNKTVRQTLDILFEGGLEYDETDKHVILKKAAQQAWYASGYVYDGNTGEKMSNVSVYERRQLVSTMTNEQGYYRLKLKDKSQPAQISISKAYYIDTMITVKPAGEQELTVSIKPREMMLDTVEITTGVDKSWLGKMFVSSRQRMQSLNMSKFFVSMPVQVSLTPGIGTHGKMSQQVVNKFSFNVLGGYTAGTNGFELGMFFNINKQDAQYMQVAGVFNLVEGNVYGTQIGGLYNHVLDSVEGIQIAGLGNNVKGAVDGGQVGGFFNYAKQHVKGSQVSGFGNVSNGSVHGAQISGFGNYAKEKLDGVQITGAINIAEEVNGGQIGGLFNYAKRLDGFQIGVFNYADTSSGYSLGFLSFVRKGYHKASISTNEVFNVNLAFKTGGNAKFYSILFLGANLGKQEAYSYGYGIGSEIKLAKKLVLNPEISAHFLYLGSWDVNILTRGSLNLQYKPGKNFAIFAGPCYSYYYTDQKTFFTDFKSHPAPAGYKVETINSNWSSWMGWNVGVNIF